MNAVESTVLSRAFFAHHLPREPAELMAFHANLVQRIGSRATMEPVAWASRSVSELGRLIEHDPIVRTYVEQMLFQVQVLPDAPPATVRTVFQLIAALEHIVTLVPLGNADPAKRHPFPISSLFAYMMMTAAGEALFRMPAFNDAIGQVLREWCQRSGSLCPVGTVCPCSLDPMDHRFTPMPLDWAGASTDARDGHH